MDNKKFILTSNEDEKNKLLKIGYPVIKKTSKIYIFENINLSEEDLLKNNININELLFSNSFHI